MSAVTVIIQLPTNDAATLEKTINESSLSATIRDSALGYGLLAHRFVSGPQGCAVIDQWPDEATFRQFFTANETRIRQMLAPVMPAQTDPLITVYQNLSTNDQYPDGSGTRTSH